MASKAPSFILALGSGKPSKKPPSPSDDDDIMSHLSDDDDGSDDGSSDKEQEHQMQLSAMDDFIKAIHQHDAESALEVWKELCQFDSDESSPDEESK